MKVLILGGTGAMGGHLRHLLAEKGALVSVTTRQTLPSEGGIKYISGNAKDDDFLRTQLEQRWDCIVDFMTYSTADFRRRLPFLLTSTMQYVFLSSARVYARSEKPLTEDSPRLLDVSDDRQYLKSDEYALAKARQENLLSESGHKNWTILRPYITYAEERLQLGVLEKEAWLFRALQGRTIVFSSDIAERTTTLTSGLDVAGAISGLIGLEKALGESFHITCDFPRTWHEIFGIYKKTLTEYYGECPKIRFVDLDSFMITHSSRYQIIYDRLYNRIFDNDKIRSLVSTDLFFPPEQGLKLSLLEFLKKLKFSPISSLGEGMRDRLTGEKTALRHFYGLREKLRYLACRYKP